MTPQSSQSTPSDRDHLDDAIDRVAKQLTHVDDDALFATRVIAALPERTTWFGWLMHSWAPRLAMIAIIVGAVALWNVRRVTTELPAVSTTTLTAYAPALVPVAPEFLEPVGIEPLEPRRTKPMEPGNPGTVEPFIGLPSIEAPKAIAVNDIGPQALPVEDALAVPPLAIAELPLTAESFPERD